MMDESLQSFWQALLPLLDSFGAKISASENLAACLVGRSSNAAPLFRGYVGMRKRANGEELAVVVAAAIIDEVVVLSSDACMDEGDILAEGPTAAVPLSGTWSSEDATARWLLDFEDFLVRIEPAFRARLATLR